MQRFSLFDKLAESPDYFFNRDFRVDPVKVKKIDAIRFDILPCYGIDLGIAVI